jgi:hypothetical protein
MRRASSSERRFLLAADAGASDEEIGKHPVNNAAREALGGMVGQGL